MFRDRIDAGRKLAEHLRQRLAPVAGETLVLGIPRGGVIVAGPVAHALGARLDIVIPRKIGAPDQPELAVGAIALAGDEELVLQDPDLIATLGIPPAYLVEEAARQRREIERRTAAYREGRRAEPLAGRTVLIVDDGVATGLTARAAAAAVARAAPARLIVAVPVAPAGSVRAFQAHGLVLEALATPSGFMAVGQFYQDFHAVEDGEVLAVLRGPAAALC